MKTIKYTILTDDLYREWEQLWKNSSYANPVNSPAWFKAACEAFGYKKFKIVAVYKSNGELAGIAGFVKAIIFGIPLYTIPGIEFADHSSLLADFNDRETLKIFLSEIKKLGNVYLSALHQNIIWAVRNQFKNSMPFVYDVNAYIDLKSSPEGDFSSGRKANILKRINNCGSAVSCSYHQENYKEALNIAFNIDTVSSRSKKGKCVFHKEKVKSFFSLLGDYLKTNLLVTLLSFDNKPAGYHIGFIYNGVYSGNQKGHLAEYNYYSPGKYLELNLLNYLNTQGIGEYDFGRGYDNVKMAFTRNTRLLYNVVISDNIFIKLFIPAMHKFRNYLYSSICKNKMLYLKYKNIKNLINRN